MAQGSTAQAWSRGGLFFAATVMIMVGIFQIFEGIAAIARNSFFVVAPNYVYEINTTAWGWIHLGIGVLALVAGFFLFTGSTWARVVGIFIAMVAVVANFFFLPYYPLWSLLIIAVSIFAIWAMSTARVSDRLTEAEAAAAGAGTFGGEAPQAGERWPATSQPGGRHWAPEAPKEAPTPGATTPSGKPSGAPSGMPGAPKGGEAIPPTAPQQ